MKIEKRTDKVNKIRREGFVPGVIYGKKIESTPIQIKEESLFKALKDYGKNTTFKVQLEDKTHQVYFQDLQENPLKAKDIIHFSLLKVTASDTITTEIPVNVMGKENIERKNLLLQLIHQTLEVEFPVGSGINTIDVDVSQLEEGDAVYVKDLEVPKGFKFSVDADEIVANVVVPKMEEPEETDDEQTEPELIGEEDSEETTEDNE
jgi:large subunit ribosomal protein L25